MAPVYLLRGIHRVSQMVATATYPATCGVQVRCGVRQSIPSSEGTSEYPLS